MFYVRDGLPFVRVPERDAHSPVPQEFLIVLGIASVFLDKDFRKQCLAACEMAAEQGYLQGIIDYVPPDRDIN